MNASESGLSKPALPGAISREAETDHKIELDSDSQT
jgi:hypothetical protein